MTVLENVMVGAFGRGARPRRPRWRTSEGRAGVLPGWPGAALIRPGASADAAREAPVGNCTGAGDEVRGVLLLDEMLTGPDADRGGLAAWRWCEPCGTRGVTILMVEHVMEVVLPLVDRAVVLNLGRVLMQGSPADVVKPSGCDPGVSGGQVCRLNPCWSWKDVSASYRGLAALQGVSLRSAAPARSLPWWGRTGRGRARCCGRLPGRWRRS